ncbi:MAG: sodium:solute symporter family protein [Cyclobacteriaceae bacterium]
MHSLDYITVALFALGVLGVGFSFMKSSTDMKGFFSAGGQVPWWISGLSLFMSFFSAGTFVVWGSIAYTHGWVSVTIQWTMAIAGFIIGFFIAPRWQEAKVLTAAEYIQRRLGLNVQKVYSYLFLAVSMFTTGGFLYPVAKIIQVSTGFPLGWSIVLLGLMVILYTSAGGLWAVIATDVLQFVILTVAVLIIVPLALDKAGGLSGFTANAPDKFFEVFSGEYTLGFVLAFGLYNLFFIGGNWAYVQRYTSVASKKDAKKVGYLFGSLYLISPVIWMLPPMLYRVLNPDLNGFGDEGAYLLMSKEVLPIGMLGLMLGAMIFATASSVNTSLNIVSGVFTNDIYKKLRPQASDAHLMRVARLATAVFGVLTIIVALLITDFGGIVEVILSVAALTGGALYLPPLWSLFSKVQTGRSILSVSVICLAINVFFKFIAPSVIGFSLDRTEEMMLGVMSPLLLLCCYEVYFRVFAPKQGQEVSSITEPEEINESLETSSGNAENEHGLKVISWGIALVGIVVLLISFVAENGQAVVIAAGLAVAMIGIAMIFKIKSNK